MTSATAPLHDRRVHPVTPERWPDLEKLFGPRGAYGGCWCMWFRLRRKDFAQNSGEQNRRAMKEIVDSGQPPGLLAYVDGQPAGWVSLAPRQQYPHLQHSRKLQCLPAGPGVWSIVCFVIGKRFRRQGLMVRLLEAATSYAREQGGTSVEAFPVEPGARLTGYDGFTGIASTFRRAGFAEAGRLSDRRLIMRRTLEQEHGPTDEG